MRKLSTLFAAVVFAACAQNSPLNTANQATAENRPEMIAFALYASYVVVSERAVTLAEAPDTPAEVKAALIKLHDVAAPAARQIRAAAQEYNNVRAALAEGTSTPDKVAIALAELQRVLTDAAPKLGALADATSGGSP